MNSKTLLRYDFELTKILLAVEADTIFVSKDVDIHGNILRKMWQEGIILRAGKQKGLKGSHTYKISATIKAQFEAIMNGKEDKS